MEIDNKEEDSQKTIKSDNAAKKGINFTEMIKLLLQGLIDTNNP